MNPKEWLVLMRSNVVLVFVSLLTISSGISGQIKFSKPETAQLIKQGKYSEVHNSLELSYRAFPADPDYIFWLGLCKVQLNYDIPKAVFLLNEATQQNLYEESWFYLAKANMLNFEFARASELFNIYGDKANRVEKEKVALSLNQSWNLNAADICSRCKKLNVIRADTIAENDLLLFLNKQQTGGTFVFNGEFNGFTEIGNGIRFSVNNRDFFTKHPFGKKQKDIFVSEKDDIGGNKTKTIGNLINTAFDEAFVYFDETVPAVYFSSQGHNSVGGYDIFLSYFDNATKKWSQPKNIGFPVNTPGDEIAWVNIHGTKRSILAARRNTSPSKVVVYTIEEAESASTEPISPVQALELSRLKPGKQLAIPVVANKPSEKKEVVYKRNEVPVEIRDEKTYQKLIHEALSLQISSDSVRRISDQKKELLISTKPENERKKLWQEIRLLDSKADEISQKADILYKKARRIETDKEEMTRQNSRELAQKAFSGKNVDPGNSNEIQKPGANTNGNSTDNRHAIHYRIQVGVFSKPQPDDMFKGFTELYKEDLKEGSAFKYYVGLYQKISDAEKGLIRVKGAGFKDAYIIGFYNGKIVPLSRARELEISGRKL